VRDHVWLISATVEGCAGRQPSQPRPIAYPRTNLAASRERRTKRYNGNNRAGR
jgi:hypothetical protein